MGKRAAVPWSMQHGAGEYRGERTPRTEVLYGARRSRLIRNRRPGWQAKVSVKCMADPSKVDLKVGVKC